MCFSFPACCRRGARGRSLSPLKVLIRARTNYNQEHRIVQSTISHCFDLKQKQVMKKLFNTAFSRILRHFDVADTALPPSEPQVRDIVAKIYKHDIPYSKLSRLPASEVKTMLKIPCPLAPGLGKEEVAESTAVFKRLRHNFTVEEESVCFKCSRQCPVRRTPFKQLEVKLQTNNKSALHDLLLFLFALQQTPEAECSQLRWSAAYKTTTSLAVLLQDYKILGAESLLFRQVLKNLQEEEKEYLNKQKKREVREAEQVEAKLKDRKIGLPESPYS